MIGSMKSLARQSYRISNSYSLSARLRARGDALQKFAVVLLKRLPELSQSHDRGHSKNYVVRAA